MGDDEAGAVAVAVEVAEQREDVVGGVGVEVAGGLVGEDQVGLEGQRAGVYSLLTLSVK